MSRFILKFPLKGLSRISRCNSTKIQFQTRILRARNYCSKKNVSPCEDKKRGGTGFVYTIGTLVLASGGTIAYAKYDPEFRKFMAAYVPYSDDFFKFIFQEDKPITESVLDFITDLKEQLWIMIFGRPISTEIKDCPELELSKDYAPPRSAFQDLVDAEKPAPEENWTEIRVMDESGGKPDPNIEVVQEKPVTKEEDQGALPETHPRNMSQLEEKIGTAAVEAVTTYNEATCALRDYNMDIFQLVETSVENLDRKVWSKLKRSVEKRDGLLKEVETKAGAAMNHLAKMKDLLDRNELGAPAKTVECARRNLSKVLEDVEAAARNLEREKAQGVLADRYWKKVEKARMHFTEELEILFPSIRIHDRQLSLAAQDLDLFVLHVFQTVMLYQKELARLETVADEKMRRALRVSGAEGEEAVIRAQLEEDFNRQRRNMTLEFQKKMLEMRATGEGDLRRQLRMQTEAHADHLREAVTLKEQEVERRVMRIHEDRLAREEAKYKLQLATMIGRLKGMEKALKARSDANSNARKCQGLWAASQALFESLKVTELGVPWQDQLQPLKHMVEAVTNAASSTDDLVRAVVSGIPEVAVTRGVYPEVALKERFLKVERVARRVALMPDGGGLLPTYLLSYLQSLLLVRSANPIPQAELANEPVDLESLDTYDILQRARYWMDRGDFYQTLRYMNLLKGASRCVARDWIDEARNLLETQQAANVLMAYAAASGLSFL